VLEGILWQCPSRDRDERRIVCSGGRHAHLEVLDAVGTARPRELKPVDQKRLAFGQEKLQELVRRVVLRREPRGGLVGVDGVRRNEAG